jgi:iron complex transport system substrate-binding protein
MRWRPSRRLFAAATLAVVATPAGAAPPRRIASLNPCLDAMLVHLADRSQIAALSHYARDATSSSIADIAATLPITYESAEEILALAPDLVLASQHSGPATRNALARLNIPVETFGVPATVADSNSQIRQLARAIGQGPRGDALVARIDAAIAATAPPTGLRPIKALVFQARGLSPGKGNLIDEMLTRTGFENVATRYGVDGWGQVSLEQLLSDPPELLLAGEAAPGAPTWSERLLSHPALARIAHRMQQATFPAYCLYCAGPVLLKTAPLLAQARARYLAA